MPELYRTDHPLSSGGSQPAPPAAADAVVVAGVPLDARIIDASCGAGLSGRALAERRYRHLPGCEHGHIPGVDKRSWLVTARRSG